MVRLLKQRGAVMLPKKNKELQGIQIVSQSITTKSEESNIPMTLRMEI
jgi:hypothetical protein